MKRQIFAVIVIIFANIWFVNAQLDSRGLYFFGHVYYENVSGKQIMLPFTTIKIYEESNPETVKFTRFAGTDGSYRVDNIDISKSYILIAYAPGLKEQSFLFQGYNKQPSFKGNLSTHMCLETSDGFSTPLKKKIFTPKILSINKKSKIKDLFDQLPCLKNEDEDYVTNNGGSVRIFVNGASVQPRELSVLFKSSFKAVKSIEYYNLEKFGNSAYQGVINIILTAGEQVKPPKFKCQSIKIYKKQ